MASYRHAPPQRDALEVGGQWGNPSELGAQYAEIKPRLKSLNVFGGCCGTDARHIEQIALACAPLFDRAT